MAASGFWHLTDEGQKIRSCLGERYHYTCSVDQYLGGNCSYLNNMGSQHSDLADDYSVLALMNGWSSLFSGFLYFDSNCNHVPLSQVPANSCDAGHVLWRGSPISLNFAPLTTIARDVTFTQFPLIPGSSENWFAWKASADHPLLVIDPAHKGEITSPYQLFGNWSFGGEARSLKTMLASSALPAKDAKPWRHGFEALATLDADNDGTVKGTELAPLALWFDNNRNGISEQGEVKTLADAGITALFYKDSQYDQELDGFHLALGFERTVDGKRAIGSSFDWFSPGDTSKERLITSELSKGHQRAQGGVVKDYSDLSLPKSEPDKSAAINGSWEWVSDLEQNPDEPTIGGILEMVAFKNGELLGVTIAESHYAQPYPVNSMVSFTTFKGTLKDSKNIVFSLQSKQWELQTSATLSADGRTLVGKTTATQANNKKSFSYTWTAKKTG